MTAIAQALSAALLHFIWQGTLVAFLLWVALLLLERRTAAARYFASCAALAIMAALPPATAWYFYAPAVAAHTAAGLRSAPLSAFTADGNPGQSLADWLGIIQHWALPVWSAGVFLFALRLVWSCRHVSLLRRDGAAAEPALRESVARLAARMGVTRAVRVLISSVAESPSVTGWIRPVILLPASTLLGLTREQLEAVLAHEIAHIRRHDYLINLLQTFVETLLFYHPAVWWASSRIRHERELCCDDAAVRECGNPIDYARALAKLERIRVTPAVLPEMALSSNGGSLLYRVRRLTGMAPEHGPSKAPGIIALALGVVCFAVNVHWAHGQEPVRTAQGQTIAINFQPRAGEERGITVSTNGELLHRNRVTYPEAAMKQGIQGTVTLEVTLDTAGNVSDARVTGGPPELRKTALQSVLQWHFANGAAGDTRLVNITFQPSAAGAEGDASEQAGQRQQMPDEALLKQKAELDAKLAAAAKRDHERSSNGQGAAEDPLATQSEKQIAERKAQTRDSMRAELDAMQAELRAKVEARMPGRTLEKIDVSGLPGDARDNLTATLPIHIGDTLSTANIEAAEAAIRSFDEHLEFRFIPLAEGQAALQVTVAGSGWGKRL